MKEYIEREAAIDHLIGVTVIKYTPAFSLGMGAAAAEIQMLPAADVVEVVRCKDCKHFTEGMAVGMCKRIPDKQIIPMPYNNYCGFGERRE